MDILEPGLVCCGVGSATRECSERAGTASLTSLSGFYRRFTKSLLFLTSTISLRLCCLGNQHTEATSCPISTICRTAVPYQSKWNHHQNQINAHSFLHE